MPKRIVSIWFPRLATDRLCRLRGDAWRSEPGAVVARVGSRLLVAGTNAAAEAAGISRGLALADARTLLPGLKIAPADAVGDAAALAKIAGWGERYTPWVAVDGADGLFLDVTGCTHLFGGEANLIADLERRFVAMEISCRLALADTPGAAWAIARFGDSGSIIASRKQRDTLASLPVTALRLDAATADDLPRLGLAQIGNLYPLHRAALAARFGRALVTRLDQALGGEEEPISPLRPPPRHRVVMRFPEPIAAPESIAAALDRLLAHLCRGLAQQDEGGRRFELTLFRTDHSTQMLAIGTGQAQRTPERLKRLFADRMDQVDPGFGIETLLLAAHGVEPLQTAQATLPAAAAKGDSLDELVDRLSNRLGPARVLRYAPLASHMPERAFRPQPAGEGKAPPVWSKRATGPTRPLRLLARPEPLEAIALCEDGSPPASFRWRHQPHRLRRAVGPERILPEWWLGDGAWNGRTRDYWRIEDDEGGQFWLFRDGDAARPRWFLHGVFT
jgi:protein ImuB